MPRLMSTPAGVVVVVLLQGSHGAGASGCMMQGRGDHSYMAMGLHRQDGEHALFACQASVVFARFFVCIVCCTLYFNGHLGASAIEVIVMHCNDYYGGRISYLKGLLRPPGHAL